LPAISIGVGLLASVAHNFWRESKRKREIQGIFGSYVSKQVVEKLLKNPEAIKLERSRKRVDHFLSDLAGFTDLSKTFARGMWASGDRYLAAVTDFILDNGGFVENTSVTRDGRFRESRTAGEPRRCGMSRGNCVT